MRHEGVVRVRWTRAELAAIREAIEVTPNFEGRLEAREILRHAYRSPRGGDIEFEAGLAERLSGRGRISEENIREALRDSGFDPNLVTLAAEADGDVIGQELQRNGVDRRRLEVAHVLRHGDDGDTFRRGDAGIRDRHRHGLRVLVGEHAPRQPTGDTADLVRR